MVRFTIHLVIWSKRMTPNETRKWKRRIAWGRIIFIFLRFPKPYLRFLSSTFSRNLFQTLAAAFTNRRVLRIFTDLGGISPAALALGTFRPCYSHFDRRAAVGRLRSRQFNL